MEGEIFRRRRLPHWEVPGATYFVTTCLDGSIPARGQLEIARYQLELRQRKPLDALTLTQWQHHCAKLAFARIDHWLDGHSANRALADPKLATIVVESILHFAGERYDLFAFVVMPSHYHWLFRPLDACKPAERTARKEIEYSLNRYTATQCNRLLGRRGRFWQNESYDHWVRDEDELDRIIEYIEMNPVKAGLASSREEWPCSSASLRRQRGLDKGQPILPHRA